MSKLVASMASNNKKTKRVISPQEKTKMDITRPPGQGYLSEIRS